MKTTLPNTDIHDYGFVLVKTEEELAKEERISMEEGDDFGRVLILAKFPAFLVF